MSGYIDLDTITRRTDVMPWLTAANFKKPAERAVLAI